MKSDDTDGKILKSEEVKSGLISLINRKKTTFQGGFAEIVKREFDLICEAKKNGARWAEIVDSLGFPEKENGFTVAYSRELRRRAKKEKEVMSAAPAKTQKTENLKTKKEDRPGAPVSAGARPGITTPTGRGKFIVNEELPLDKL